MFYETTRGTAYEPLHTGIDKVDSDTDQDQLSKDSVFNRAMDETGDWVGRHPVASVAIGLALGATVGWLIKRR